MRVWVLAMVAACVVLAGCGDKPVPPFASAPFSVARKGNVLSIPFEIPPTANLSYGYILAFKYTRPDAGDPLLQFWSRPQRAHLFLRVRLVEIDAHGRELRIEVHSSHNQEERSLAAEFGRDVVSVDVRRTGRSTVDMVVGQFTAPRHGTYRFDVETMHDSVSFEPITSWLTVQREFAGPK